MGRAIDLFEGDRAYGVRRPRAFEFAGRVAAVPGSAESLGCWRRVGCLRVVGRARRSERSHAR
jgi:hypothetical protein